MLFTRKPSTILGTALVIALGAAHGLHSPVMANRFTPKLHKHLTKKSPTKLDASTLTKYVDPLPIPEIIQPYRETRETDYYAVKMTEFKQKLHRQLPPTTVWGYGDARSPYGTFPGPTFNIKSSRKINVTWLNEIQSDHYLIPGVYDHSLHGANANEPEVRGVPHLHGAVVRTDSDGDPDAWFSSYFNHKGPTWEKQTYTYNNPQEAMNLWYHDHTVGATRLSVYAGLAGAYLIHDDFEKSLNLPDDAYDLPLLIQDRTFNMDGSLSYDTSPLPVSNEHPGPWVPEMFGDAILVNGKVWPYLDVEPRKYRFRVYNGSNARFYNLKLGNGEYYWQIGSEQGLFDHAVKQQQLLIAPGERADIIVDFSKLQNQTLQLTNDAKAPYPDGDDPVETTTVKQIMQFRVSKKLKQADTSSIPDQIHKIDWQAVQAAASNTPVRNFALIEHVDADDNPIMVLINNKRWHDPASQEPHAGTTERWNIINTTGDTHPLHMHLAKFHVISRQPLDVDKYMSLWNPGAPGTGPDAVDPTAALIPNPVNPIPLEAAEQAGWKDTVRINPGEVVQLLVQFPSGYQGDYPIHCHILEHEDNDMMWKFKVVQ